ncbi:hypothetical protein Rhein_0233 [Rheinheimera sp. A13L]|uniref:hypothetical protein n=1 Tax=Rheinheimera sp. A13L TaxID=506534 RepID=UPI0002124E24|nr:hypothetical protein [Rheinheimera sp. A13L]EGM79773.1 hypothetical protein Rhein_0233 [Rheinheimera sp. A13L]
MKNYIALEEPLAATITAEGFIEVTALDELDKIVGGLLNPEDVYIELNDESAKF